MGDELEKEREELDAAIKKADRWEMEHRRIKGCPHNPILALMAQTQDYRTAAEAEIERLKTDRDKFSRMLSNRNQDVQKAKKLSGEISMRSDGYDQ